MITKTHKNHENKIVVAVCDSELLGKKYEEDNKQLDLTSDFYQGEEKEDVAIGDLMRNADSVNLVGEKAVKLAIDEEIIDEEHVKKIAGIPYAQIAVLRD